MKVPSSLSTLITLTDVSVTYGTKEVLCHLSLTIAERDFVVLRGPNGGGKTTLLKLLVGLIKPQSGHIERRENITVGYLPQYRSIDRQFPITVFETVRSGLQCNLHWWQRYGKREGEHVWQQLHDLDLVSLASHSISTLSGGQWQRTLLARALVSQPDLLLLDEPDTHLDSTSRTDLYVKLCKENRQRAIVVVSHDLHLQVPDSARYISIGD